MIKRSFYCWFQKKSGSSKSKPKSGTGTVGGLGFGLLPPPPGSSHKVPGPPSAKNSPPAPSPTGSDSGGILPAPPSSSELSNADLLGGLLDDSASAPAPVAISAPTGVATNGQNLDLWGDFASAQK